MGIFKVVDFESDVNFLEFKRVDAIWLISFFESYMVKAKYIIRGFF